MSATMQQTATLAADVIKIVTDVFGESFKAMQGNEQYVKLARARSALFAILSNELGISNEEISQLFNLDLKTAKRASSQVVKYALKCPIFEENYMTARLRVAAKLEGGAR